MASPLLLFCDTDCLIQLFAVNKIAIFRWFKARYSLEAVVVPEVEAELSWHMRFRDRFEPEIRKATAAGVLRVLDYSKPEQIVSFLPSPSAAEAASRSIIKTGQEYALRVGEGEAYSHAACIYLGMPLLSHDKSAINSLCLNNLRTAAPVLRVFDLLALAYQKEQLVVKDCDAIRQQLNRLNEFVPKSFRHAAFESGLRSFDQRLYELPPTAARPNPCQSYNDPFFLDPE